VVKWGHVLRRAFTYNNVDYQGWMEVVMEYLVASYADQYAVHESDQYLKSGSIYTISYNQPNR